MSKMLIVMHDGRKVGEIAQSAPNAGAYVDALVEFYKGAEVLCETIDDGGICDVLARPPSPRRYSREGL